MKNNKLTKGIKSSSSMSVIIIFIVIFVVVGIMTGGRSLRWSNILNICQQATTVGIITVGMSMVIIDRGIDLSVGGIAAFTSTIGAILMTKTSLPWIVCVFIMLLVGTLFGLINGLSIAKLKMPAFITTMATLQISQGLSHFLLGGKTINGLPKEHTVFAKSDFLFIPISVWMLIIATVVGMFVLSNTKFGRELYAMGGNPKAAWTTGINVVKNRVIIYCISGFAASCAALIITSRIMCAQVTIGEGIELDSIASAVIGGVSMAGGEGGVFGAVIGSVVIVMIKNGMNLLLVSPYLQKAISGLVIFVAIAADVIRRRKELSHN